MYICIYKWCWYNHENGGMCVCIKMLGQQMQQMN